MQKDISEEELAKKAEYEKHAGNKICDGSVYRIWRGNVEMIDDVTRDLKEEEE